MKLATLHDGSRDGQLAVVSRDLSLAHFAAGIASTLQQLLDDWNFISPQLEDLASTLNQGKARHAFAFDPRHCMAPLPRAFHWAEAVADGELHTPVLAHGAGDGLLGPCASPRFAAGASGVACQPGLAVVTGDLAGGSTVEAALDSVRLLLLVNGWRSSAGAGTPAFGPLAVTPDELGTAWQGGQVHLPLQARLNGRTLPAVAAAAATRFHFGQLIATLAQPRALGAGAIVGGGALACIDGDGGGLQAGDRVRVEFIGSDGISVFGAIDQALPAAD
jgi:fumarylacetoacetate (FAA) hydrolase